MRNKEEILMYDDDFSERNHMADIFDIVSLDKERNLTESIDEDKPYSYNEVKDELKSLTHNFTDKDGTVKCFFEKEKDFGKKVLKKYYDIVEISDSRRREDDTVEYVITYSKRKTKKLKESKSLNEDIREEYIELDNIDELIDRLETFILYTTRSYSIHTKDGFDFWQWWVPPHHNLSIYPIVQIDYDDKTIFHEEGQEAGYSHLDMDKYNVIDNACEFLKEFRSTKLKHLNERNNNLKEAVDNGNDSHQTIDLGYIKGVNFSATIYDKTGNIYVNQHHPYDDAEYSWAYKDRDSDYFKIIKNRKVIDYVETDDLREVAEILVRYDKDVKPKMMHW